MPDLIDVDLGDLHLPPGRSHGADPGKLARQIARHGSSLEGMPPLQLIRGAAGQLRINNGVTRATRAAKLRPGERVRAEVIQELPKVDVAKTPKVKDVLPRTIAPETSCSKPSPSWAAVIPTDGSGS